MKLKSTENIRTACSGLFLKAIMNEAVDYAIEHNFLEGFFKEEKAKVMNSILTQFDKEVYEKSIRQEGREEGAQQKAIEAARAFYGNGASIELIAKSLKMTEEQVREIVSKPAPQE